MITTEYKDHYRKVFRERKSAPLTKNSGEKISQKSLQKV